MKIPPPSDTDAPQYGQRDTLVQGNYFMRHMLAMTGESLHAKSDIAAELAHRDMEIDRLRKESERLDWMERAINNKGSVWILPCGESLRFVQVRHCGDCHNYPTVEGFRAAIDAAMLAAPAVGAA